MRPTSFKTDFEKYWLIYIVILCAAALSKFGRQVLMSCVVSGITGYITALLCCALRKESVFARGAVLWILLPLLLPASLPLWSIIVAVIFGEIVVRQAFGGYGRNLVNPLAVAIVFLWVSYPAVLRNAAQSAAPIAVSPLITMAALLLFTYIRALDAAFPLSVAATLLFLASFRHFTNSDFGVSFSALAAEIGWLAAMAAAGLDVYSLPRTPSMRYIAGIIFAVLYVTLSSFKQAMSPAFAALLITNLLTPIGDAILVAKRVKSYASD